MLYKVPTNKPYLFIIKDEDKMIGRLSTKGDGVFYFITNEPYRKLNSFGVKKELLLSKEIKFKKVLVICKKIGYYTTKEKILQDGIEQEFDFGIKVHLEISKWFSAGHKQLRLNFTDGN